MNYRDQIKEGKWQKKRLEIMNRDGFKCRACKGENSLNVHHLYYLPGRMIWDYDNEGLVTLCEVCHRNIHNDLSKISGIIAFEILLERLDPFINPISIRDKLRELGHKF